MAQGGYRPPPPPFLGGRQPYEPARLPAALLASAADAPPPKGASLAAMLAIVATAWAVAPASRLPGPDPYKPRQLNPSITAIQVDAPPPLSTAEELALIRATWPASAWGAQSAPKMVWQSGASADQPPPLVRDQIAQRVWPQPSWPAQFSPKTAQQTDSSPGPYVRQRIDWPAVTWPAQRAPAVAAVAPAPATVDNPPPYVRAQIVWPAITWPAQWPKRTAALPGASVDNPPGKLPQPAWIATPTWSLPPRPGAAAIAGTATPPIDTGPIPGGGWPIEAVYGRREIRERRSIRESVEHVLHARYGRHAYEQSALEAQAPQLAQLEQQVLDLLAPIMRADVPGIDWQAIRLAQIRENLQRAMLAFEIELQRLEDEDDEDLLLLSS